MGRLALNVLRIVTCMKLPIPIWNSANYQVGIANSLHLDETSKVSLYEVNMWTQELIRSNPYQVIIVNTRYKFQKHSTVRVVDTLPGESTLPLSPSEIGSVLKGKTLFPLRAFDFPVTEGPIFRRGLMHRKATKLLKFKFWCSQRRTWQNGFF